MSSDFAAAEAQAIQSKDTFRVLPAGRFKASDGRPAQGAWLLTPQQGARLALASLSSVIDSCIDYEHQTLKAEKNGLPAPAAGWFRRLEWRDDGLYVTDARWTARAKSMIDSGEYRFVSPVFSFDKRTLEVHRLINIALTNTPALPSLTDLASLQMAGTDGHRAPLDRQALEDIALRTGISPQELEAAVNDADRESALLESAPPSARFQEWAGGIQNA